MGFNTRVSKLNIFQLIVQWIDCHTPVYCHIIFISRFLRLHTKQTIDYSSVLPLILESNDHVSYLVFCIFYYIFMFVYVDVFKLSARLDFHSRMHIPPLFLT
jgi:hypothetical protein